MTRTAGVAAPPSATPSLALPKPAAIEPGTLVDRFLVIEAVGEGGLGLVFAAYDPELDRKVALKFLKHSSQGADIRDQTARLLREAQAMARLRHPNVVTVYDVGTHDGRVYLAMEFVEGKTLADWLRTPTRPWADVRDVILAAGRGLAAAHAAGLVHRDFKPSNVMVQTDGTVLVLDFGLAQAQQPPQPPSTPATQPRLCEPVTHDSVLIGTLPYMAPELFAGQPASAASDQFAFCVTLYEALHGERPFRCADAADYIDAVDAAAGSGRPRWLQRHLRRGLDPDPSARHPSMDALLTELTADRRRRGRRWLHAALVAALGAGVGAVATEAVRPEASAADLSQIEALSSDARNAAQRGHYVYPSVDDPHRLTALQCIVELESLDGPAAETAARVAQALRKELAAQLVEVADTLAKREGGAGFSADLFAAALVLDPGSPQAAAGNTLTTGQLAALQRQAERGEFSLADLVAFEPHAALADTDLTRRAQKLAAVERRQHGVSAATREQLRSLVGDHQQRRTPVESPRPADPPAESEGEPPSASSPPAPVVQPRPSPDVAKGRAATAAGRAAVGRGRLTEAKGHFHRALEHNQRDVAALEGLADIAFQQNRYSDSLRHARRAVRLAPRKASLHVMLGDAYERTLRYKEARDEYARAQSLGSQKATARLQRLRKRLGE